MSVASASCQASESPSLHPRGDEPRRVTTADVVPSARLRLVAVGEESRLQLLAHFVGLPVEDRRMRFMQFMSDEALASHMAGVDLARDVRLAFLDPFGSPAALAEGFTFAAGACLEMEVAFSTDVAWRRLGLARLLWAAIAQRARDSGVERVVLQCDSRNAGMRGLLNTVGARARVENSEVHAVWPVATHGARLAH